MKRFTGFCILLAFLIAIPLGAAEELMSRLFFEKWLDNSLRPLEASISDLQKTYQRLADEAAELARNLKTEIKITIDSRRAFIDGQAQELEVAPFIFQDRTMVPVRFIGEALDAEFLWEEKTRKVTYIYRNLLLEIFIEQTEGFLNRKPFQLETPPIIREGRTMVPLRFISEQLGAQVNWEEKTRSVTIIK